MSSSRTSSPVPSLLQPLLSYLPPTCVDDGLEFTPTTSDAVPDDETDILQCKFDIDWENIWHNGTRLLGAKRRPRHKRVIGTKVKEPPGNILQAAYACTKLTLGVASDPCTVDSVAVSWPVWQQTPPGVFALM